MSKAVTETEHTWPDHSRNAELQKTAASRNLVRDNIDFIRHLNAQTGSTATLPPTQMSTHIDRTMTPIAIPQRPSQHRSTRGHEPHTVAPMEVCHRASTIPNFGIHLRYSGPLLELADTPSGQPSTSPAAQISHLLPQLSAPEASRKRKHEHEPDLRVNQQMMARQASPPLQIQDRPVMPAPPRLHDMIEATSKRQKINGASFLHRPAPFDAHTLSQVPRSEMVSLGKFYRKIVALSPDNHSRLVGQNGRVRELVSASKTSKPKHSAPSSGVGNQIALRAYTQSNASPTQPNASAKLITQEEFCHQQTSPAVGAHTGFVPPSTPNAGIFNIMNSYDIADLEPYLQFLRTLKPPIGKLGFKDKQYTRLAPGTHLQEMNGWLLSLLPPYQPILMLRSFNMPAANDHTALARCTRYAHSHDQRQLSWAVHPVHIALIMERTNGYGIATTPVRKEKLNSSFGDVNERNVRQLLSLR